VSADDTSREALVERVAFVLCRDAWERRWRGSPAWNDRLWSTAPEHTKRTYREDALAVVDAVILPLVTISPEQVRQAERQRIAQAIRALNGMQVRTARPLARNASTRTDFANDIEWAAQIAEGS
jgi:hypothetical protein